MTRRPNLIEMRAYVEFLARVEKNIRGTAARTRALRPSAEDAKQLVEYAEGLKYAREEFDRRFGPGFLCVDPVAGDAGEVR
jgi:hypothetical protein